MANSFLPTIDMRDELLRLMCKHPPLGYTWKARRVIIMIVPCVQQRHVFCYGDSKIHVSCPDYIKTASNGRTNPRKWAPQLP